MSRFAESVSLFILYNFGGMVMTFLMEVELCYIKVRFFQQLICEQLRNPGHCVLCLYYVGNSWQQNERWDLPLHSHLSTVCFSSFVVIYNSWQSTGIICHVFACSREHHGLKQLYTDGGGSLRNQGCRVSLMEISHFPQS